MQIKFRVRDHCHPQIAWSILTMDKLKRSAQGRESDDNNWVSTKLAFVEEK